jgi:Spy/CpxP family protein refolding chaperone
MTGGIMNKMNGMALALLLAAAPALVAQGKNPADTGRAARMQRWQGQMRMQLGLTDDQAAKLRATREKFMPQRRDIMQRERAVHEGLRGQLQPGVAANSDSVRKLLDAHMQVRVALAQLDRDQDRELAAFLTPVQRARIEMMYEHMMMRRMAGGHGRGMRGGMHPGMRGQGGGQHDESMQPAGEDESQDDAMGDPGDDGQDDGAGPVPDPDY